MSTFESIYTINLPQKLVWDFFSSPESLELITLKHINISVFTKTPGCTVKDQIIDIDIIINRICRIKWVTKILEVNEPYGFVDQQIKGPFKNWKHAHYINKKDEEHTTIHDVVSYQLPFGVFGKLLDKLFVNKMLKKLINQRYNKLEEIIKPKKSIRK